MSPLGGLRFAASIRHLARHPWHLVLTVLGVALGVALTVALDLAIQSSREAFRISQETVTGSATHQILGGVTGIPDDLPARLSVEGGIRGVAPVVEGYGVHPDHPDRLLRILGVDPFSEAPFRPFLAGIPGADGRAGEGVGAGGVTGDAESPEPFSAAGNPGRRLLSERGTALLSRETAEALAVEAGASFPLRVGARVVPIQVVGILDPQDAWSRRGLRDLLVVDVAEAQEILSRRGRLDRVDLRLTGGDDEAELARVAELLPPGASVEPAGAQTRTMQEMVRAFDLNLTALSLLGLVFAVFLIYNTMTFSVVQRRRLFGTLRALGATRGELLRGVLAEAALLGMAGSLFGVLAGILLGRGLVRLVTRTLNDLYFAVSVEGLALPPEVLLRGGLVGLAATLLAALPPAWEATTVSPGEALLRSRVESRMRVLVPRAAAAGFALAGIGVLLLLLTARSIGAAFGGLFAVILGMALMAPLATVAVVALLRPLLRKGIGILGGMAARGVVTSLSRTAPAMAALVVAVAVTVGLGVMIQSFRGSVVRWLDVTLQADLYVSAPSVGAGQGQEPLPTDLVEGARGLPGVAGVSTYRGTQFVSAYGWTRLVALDLHPAGRDGLDLLRGEADALPRFVAGEGVLLSEPFAFRHSLGPGDTVRLPSEAGELALPVLAVFRDYGSEMGTIMVARSVYDAAWSDAAVGSLAVFLREGVTPGEVAGALRSAAGPGTPVVIRENRELRALTLQVFDRTFEVTRVLRLLAFVVAFIAVLSALMALQLERVRELGVLRANGMTPGQTWGLVTAQTGIMGLVAGLLAIPTGLVLAVVMVQVVNRRSFGWTMEMQVGAEVIGQALLLALAGSLLAGLYPAWRMSRTSPAEALAER